MQSKVCREMGETNMSKINLEIIDYIRDSDFDESIKSFFLSAIIYEMRNPNKKHYKAKYEDMITAAIEKQQGE